MASVEFPAPAAPVGHATPAWPAARPRGQVGRFCLDWLPAVPLLALALAMLVAPTVMVVGQSFLDDTGRPTLAHWAETLQRRGDQRAIITSLGLGIVSATIALLVGTPLAWWLSRTSTGKRASWLSFLNVGANFGGIGLAFGFTASLGAYGMVTLLFQQMGLTMTPPQPATFLGLTIGYAYTNIPLFVLLTLPAMGMVDRESREAAGTLGASSATFWRYIGLPLLAPFLAAGWLLIFTWSIGIYGLAYALAGTAATGQLRLMTLQIGVALTSAVSTQERAAVMATLLLFIATIALLAYRAIVRRSMRWLV
ncbi:MAG: ABC transporter permease subunit [Thermomicrobiales bacterium]